MLYLLPNLLHETADPSVWFPETLKTLIPTLDGLIVENEKEGRRYLKLFEFPEGKSFRDVAMAVLSEHTTPQELHELLKPLKQGQTWGLISDCGLPLLADPGATLVHLAQEANIPIQALPGPSSLILGLMLSGLPTNRFAFHGYLPRKEHEREATIKTLEARSAQEEATQAFIEAPYRNEALFKALLATLKPHTELCLATDLTAPTQSVKTLPIAKWRQAKPPAIHKCPTLFLFSSAIR